jgi:sulfonate transport system substrate-binding protein
MPQSNPPKSRRLLLVISLVALVAIAAGLAFAIRAHGAKQGSAPVEQVLHVGDQKGGIHALLSASGELANVPYKIEWADMPAAAPLIEALSAGAVDVGSSSAPPFIFGFSNGAKIRAILATRLVEEGPAAGRGTAILVPKDSPLRTVADLRGKQLATVKGSIGHDTALKILEHAGIDPKSVKFVYLNNGDAKAALATGSIDAWSTWTPYVGIAITQNGDRPLADGHGLSNHTSGFLMASEKALATKQPLLRDFVQRYIRAQQWSFTHKEELAAQRSKETGVPLAATRYGTITGSVTQLVPIDESVIKEQQDIFARYKRAGVIDQVPELKAGGYDASFNDLVSSAQPKTP